MCDAIYLAMALVGLLAVGTALRVYVGKSPNAELLVSLLADEVMSHPDERGEQVIPHGHGPVLTSP